MLDHPSYCEKNKNVQFLARLCDMWTSCAMFVHTANKKHALTWLYNRGGPAAQSDRFNGGHCYSLATKDSL